MLSVIIITKNEEAMIEDCLVSVDWADEIVVVDSGNTDRTNAIALAHGARIVTFPGSGYARFRNAGLKAAAGDWILYVDADERVTPQLRQEIQKIVSQPTTHNLQPTTYQIPRRNIFLGRVMRRIFAFIFRDFSRIRQAVTNGCPSDIRYHLGGL